MLDKAAKFKSWLVSSRPEGERVVWERGMREGGDVVHRRKGEGRMASSLFTLTCEECIPAAPPHSPFSF